MTKITIFLIAMIFNLGGITMSSHAQETAYAFTFPKIGADDQEIKLDQFKGQVVLVVNTASRCGFTKQYAGLQELYDTYKDRGFVVLGVPSNDFGQQEPDSEQKIKEFCAFRFGITFPMTGKVHVKGKQAHPFYRWAKDQAGFMGSPKWNFHKYLIGKDGRLIDSFSSLTEPNDKKLVQAIENALK